MLIVTDETGGRVLESPFQFKQVDSDESEDLGGIGIAPKADGRWRDSWRAGCIERVHVSVRWGGVGVLGQPRPGLLPDKGDRTASI
jgi:hypothetical protein